MAVEQNVKGEGLLLWSCAGSRGRCCFWTEVYLEHQLCLGYSPVGVAVHQTREVSQSMKFGRRVAGVCWGSGGDAFPFFCNWYFRTACTSMFTASRRTLINSCRSAGPPAAKALFSLPAASLSRKLYSCWHVRWACSCCSALSALLAASVLR